MSGELDDEVNGEIHRPRCNFWCRNGEHHLLPRPSTHAWAPDPRPFMRDCCQVCGGAFHQPTSPKRGPDELPAS